MGNRTRKLVYIIYSLENPGGSERVVSILANQLSNVPKLKIFIIALYGRSSYFSINNNVDLFFLSHISASANLFNKLLCLIRVINRVKPDWITGISINRLNIFLAACSIFFSYRPKIVAADHISFNQSSAFLKIIKKILYKRFSAIVVLTDHDKSLFEKKGFKQVHKIINPSSVEAPIIQEILTRKKQIVAAGRLTYQKGFDRLIKIWALVNKDFPEWKLVIYGEGDEFENLSELKNLVGLNENCIVIEPFNKNIDNVLLQSQVYVMTSRFEGLPMVLIEALCCGCSIIAYDCETGPREIIVHNQTGLLIENNDEPAFADALRKILSTADLRSGLSINAVKESVKFEKQTVAGIWLSLYENL